MTTLTGGPEHAAQPSTAAGSGAVPVPELRASGGTPPEPAGEDACATARPGDASQDHLIAGLHSRGVLPHLKRQGGTYFVTFRQAGTLPREVFLRFMQEHETIVRRTLAARRPLTWHEREELFRWHSSRVDK